MLVLLVTLFTIKLRNLIKAKNYIKSIKKIKKIVRTKYKKKSEIITSLIKTLKDHARGYNIKTLDPAYPTIQQNDTESYIKDKFKSLLGK